jgi:NAD(P)-dependent dehydrogenase (short-subunit alcohol dehydrogenase family)
MARDPRSAGPRPPFPLQKQTPPGDTKSLEPRPDHGEDSYIGGAKFSGCAVIVTGGDSGIGRAVALAFAREGADVLISYLDEHEDARESAKWVEQAGRRAILFPGDISDESHCQAIIRAALDKFGRLDVLINNAGFQRTHENIEDISGTEIRYTFGVNIESMFYLSKAAALHMKPGSAIVNTASIQADQPSAQLLVYAATKAAITAFTASLAELLAKKGIRVNAVAPGPIWTPLIPATMPAEKAANFGGNTPLGRPGQPAEVAPAFVFLASDQACYITGAVLAVTGGRPML